MKTDARKALSVCTGRELQLFFSGGLAVLERCATAVDKLNVFPVPDGDTGTNLAATLRYALHTCQVLRADIGGVARAIALAALNGARGNSGAIFAQLCSGLAESFSGAECVESQGWADGWRTASEMARHSVLSPVEGTILTVAREGAAAAQEAAANGADLIAVWKAMVESADKTVARTPQMLKALERANVVDAGALGLALFLRGGLSLFTGDPVPEPDALMKPSASTRLAIRGANFPRYCTQFLLRGAERDPKRLASELQAYGDSVNLAPLADKLDASVHIHLHTNDPDVVLNSMRAAGQISELRIEDMHEQRARLLIDSPDQLGVIAITSGQGARRIFESLYGVAVVLEHHGNPALVLNQLRSALADAPNDGVLLLPNDEALLSTVTVVVREIDTPAAVVPTRNLPEGVAAAMAFDSSVSLEGNIRIMSQAVQQLQTITVSYAIGAGAVARSEGRPLAAGRDLIETADAGVRQFLCSLENRAVYWITVYYGAGASASEASDLAGRLVRLFPGAETEVVDAGQSECAFWIALESHASSRSHR
jgi:uncharacterized protein